METVSYDRFVASPMPPGSDGGVSSPIQYLEAGYLTFRRKGPAEVVRRFLQLLDLNYQGHFYHLNYVRKRRSRAYSHERSPYDVIEVDPVEVDHWPSKRWDKWENMGDITGGHWDRPGDRFEDDVLYETLESRFEHGREWAETEKFRRSLRKIESGEPAWNNSFTVDDLVARCEYLDDLYEEIRSGGFKSQPELQGKSNEEIVRSGSFDRSRTDVVVHIDRNGEFLFCDGRHRFAIAKILDLDSIPVRVVVRHERWQAVREQLGEGKPVHDIDGVSEEQLPHSDLRDVVDPVSEA